MHSTNIVRLLLWSITLFVLTCITISNSFAQVAIEGMLSKEEIEANSITPEDIMIGLVTSEKPPTDSGPISKPDPYVVKLDKWKIRSSPLGEDASFSTVFACQRAKELTMIGLKKYYRFQPQIFVPLLQNGCFQEELGLPDVSQELSKQLQQCCKEIGGTIEPTKVDELLSFLRELNEQLLTYRQYKVSVDSLGSKYDTMQKEFSEFWSLPFIYQDPMARGVYVGVDWYLEACAWSVERRDIIGASEYISSEHRRWNNPKTRPFAIGRELRSINAIRANWGVPQVCNVRHTTEIDDYFAYASDEHWIPAAEKPLFTLGEMEQIEELIATHLTEVDKVVDRIADVRSEAVQFLNAEILRVNSEISEHGLRISQLENEIQIRNDKIDDLDTQRGEISSDLSSATQATKDIAQDIASNKVNFALAEKRLGEVVQEVQGLLDQLSQVQVDLKTVQDECPDLFKDCTIGGTTKKAYLHQNDALAALNKAQDEIAVLGKEQAALQTRRLELSEELVALNEAMSKAKAAVESGFSGSTAQELARLAAQIQELKNENSATRTAISELRRQIRDLERDVLIWRSVL